MTTEIMDSQLTPAEKTEGRTFGEIYERIYPVALLILSIINLLMGGLDSIAQALFSKQPMGIEYDVFAILTGLLGIAYWIHLRRAHRKSAE